MRTILFIITLLILGWGSSFVNLYFGWEGKAVDGFPYFVLFTIFLILDAIEIKEKG